MRRSTALTRILLGGGFAAALIALWWAVTSGQASYSMPRPDSVVVAAKELISTGLLFESLLTSLTRVAAGFVLAFVIGAGLGIWMARSPAARAIFDPIIETFRPIAPVALVPLAILWLGTGSEAAIGLIAYSAFFPIVLNAYSAVRDMGDSVINAAMTFGTSRWSTLTQVILPGTVPGLVVGARLGIGLAWSSVIAAELVIGAGVGSTLGIGQLMYRYYQFESDPNPIVVCMLAVGLAGLALDALIREVGRLLLPWRAEARSRGRSRTSARGKGAAELIGMRSSGK